MGLNILLTIFSFVLFGTLLVSDNNVITNNVQLVTENQYAIAAFAVAQSVIDEAGTKAFDEHTVGGIEVPDSGSMSAVLAPESAEIPPTMDVTGASGYWSGVHFDDVDDYNGYRRAVPLAAHLQGDTVSVVVQYVSVADPESALAHPSYCKKMTVTVRSPYLSRPYKFSHVFTY